MLVKVLRPTSMWLLQTLFAKCKKVLSVAESVKSKSIYIYVTYYGKFNDHRCSMSLFKLRSFNYTPPSGHVFTIASAFLQDPILISVFTSVCGWGRPLSVVENILVWKWQPHLFSQTKDKISLKLIRTNILVSFHYVLSETNFYHTITRALLKFCRTSVNVRKEHLWRSQTVLVMISRSQLILMYSFPSHN